MLELMRRYVHGFVNCHDAAVAREIVAEAYTLHMGSDTLVGRDERYVPAVLHQIAQFPGLCFSIHELITDGAYTALLFSEHGRSARQPRASAAWRGVSIYRAERGRLAECWVEQDHYGRRRQLADGTPARVREVALDPWTGHREVSETERKEAGAAVEAWACGLTVWPPPGARVDTGPGEDAQARIEVGEARVNAFVAEGERVAFNLTVRGAYRGGLPGHDMLGVPVTTYAGGFATLRDGAVADVDAISNRVLVQRQLRAHADGERQKR